MRPREALVSSKKHPLIAIYQIPPKTLFLVSADKWRYRRALGTENGCGMEDEQSHDGKRSEDGRIKETLENFIGIYPCGTSGERKCLHPNS